MLRSFFPLLLLITASALSVAAQDSSSNQGRVFWKGEVDAKVRISITGTSLSEQTVSGRQMPTGSYSFTAALPNAAVTVRVNRKDGRGSVTVVQQPDASNNFTAIVEIDDSRGGDDGYLLDIYWQ